MADATITPAAESATVVDSTHKTYEQYLALPNDGRQVEWVNKEIVYSMPPLTVHQNIVSFIARLLGNFVEFFNLGRVMLSPFEMQCDPDGNSREPDILFVSTEHLDRLTPRRLEGAADLIIEVVSDDSVSRDYDDKFVEYQECGVQEYWIVDPRPRRNRAAFYQRNSEGVFEAVNPQNGIYRSAVVPNFWIKVEWLWNLPDAQLTFAEIAGFSAATIEEMKKRKA
jgi:Uma2 family endonuclease